MLIKKPPLEAFRHFGELQKEVPSVDDFDGVASEDWERVCEVDVAFPPASQQGQEIADHSQMSERNIEVAWIRWPGFEVETSWRLAVRGEIYHIAAAHNVAGIDEFVRLRVMNTNEHIPDPYGVQQ